MSEKLCGGCKSVKPLSEYHRTVTTKSGYVSQCKECAKARTRKWNIDNPERMKERSRDWQRQNRSHVKEYHREYYETNREKMLAANTQWNKDHPDVHKAANAKWRQSKRNDRGTKLRQLVRSAHVRAKTKGFTCDITVELLESYICVQDEKCVLTDIPFDFTHETGGRLRAFAPSIDRIDSSKGYTFDNIQIVCAVVNFAKNDQPQEVFDAMCRARVEVLNRAKT